MFRQLFVVSGLYAYLTLAQTNMSAQDATTFAMIYGYPLLSFQKLATPFITANFTNNFFHMRQLSTAADTTVVKPNVDTIYSVAIYDLNQHDLELTIPDIPASQFALFSFYDPYGDNYANVGTENSRQSGRYIIRRSLDDDSATGVQPQAPNGTEATAVAGVGSPTAYGVLLVRWLINSSNKDAVHAYQNATLLRTANRLPQDGAPLLSSLNATMLNASTPAGKTLELLARLSELNQPQNLNQTSLVSTTLQAAGIHDGMYTLPSGLDIDVANASAITEISQAAVSMANNIVLNNGWSMTRPGLAGNFENGTNYAYRAAIGFSGYLMLQAPIAVYPSCKNSSTSGSALGSEQFFLDEKESLLYTFSGTPPLMQTGFWSLTAYADDYLIPNDLDRYGLGDRSGLTYPDGSLVYPADALRSNGSFQILVQAADNPPPAEWISNWLPGPAGGGNMTALLRWYGAEQALLDGSYLYPIVTRQEAIKNSSASLPSSSAATDVRESHGYGLCALLVNSLVVAVLLSFT